MNIKEDAYYLRNKYSFPMMICVKVRRMYPNLDINGMEMRMYLDYYVWMSKFLDGDKSIEHFIQEYTEYKNVYRNEGKT